MKYRERIELYKRKELSAEEMQSVEADIERQEAISEYLFDRDEMPGEIDLPGDTEKENTDDPEEFTRRVNRSVRRAFVRMGVMTGAVVLALVLCILFVLPELVSLPYYDPGKTAGESSRGTTNQMSLDLAVYSELMLPGFYRTSVQVQDEGYGNYDILIPQSISFNGRFQAVTGRVERGKLKLYDVNQLQPPAGNVFGWFQMAPGEGDTLTELVAENNGHFFSAAGTREQATESLNALDDNSMYLACVTLDRLMEYEDYIELTDRIAADGEETQNGISGLWCAPVTGKRETADPNNGTEEMLQILNLGFYTDPQVGEIPLDWDREKYPDLVLWAAGEDGKDRWEESREMIRDSRFAAEHFAVMLDYMADQEKFLKLSDGTAGLGGYGPEVFREAAEYVRENGLTVYGFVCMGKKEALLRLNNMEGIYEIYTLPLI